MLFYDREYNKNDGALHGCKFYHKSKYRHHNMGATNKKQIPIKAIFYLPKIPMLQRMYA